MKTVRLQDRCIRTVWVNPSRRSTCTANRSFYASSDHQDCRSRDPVLGRFLVAVVEAWVGLAAAAVDAVSDGIAAVAGVGFAAEIVAVTADVAVVAVAVAVAAATEFAVLDVAHSDRDVIFDAGWANWARSAVVNDFASHSSDYYLESGVAWALRDRVRFRDSVRCDCADSSCHHDSSGHGPSCGDGSSCNDSDHSRRIADSIPRKAAVRDADSTNTGGYTNARGRCRTGDGDNSYPNSFRLKTSLQARLRDARIRISAPVGFGSCRQCNCRRPSRDPGRFQE